MKLAIAKTDNATEQEITWAFNADWISQKQLNILRGDYSQVTGCVIDAFRSAELCVHGYMISRDPKRMISVAIAKLLNCSKNDVHCIDFTSGTFSAKVDGHADVSGVYMIGRREIEFKFN